MGYVAENKSFREIISLNLWHSENQVDTNLQQSDEQCHPYRGVVVLQPDYQPCGLTLKTPARITTQLELLQ